MVSTASIILTGTVFHWLYQRQRVYARVQRSGERVQRSSVVMKLRYIVVMVFATGHAKTTLQFTKLFHIGYLIATEHVKSEIHRLSDAIFSTTPPTVNSNKHSNTHVFVVRGSRRGGKGNLGCMETWVYKAQGSWWWLHVLGDILRPMRTEGRNTDARSLQHSWTTLISRKT